MKNASVLTIDLGALACNYSYLSGHLKAGALAAAVVKADAYGLGAARAVPALQARGCPFYFVATPDEALAVRALTEKPIAALYGVWDQTAEDFAEKNIIPVLNNISDIDVWKKTAEKRGRRLPAVLHFDTGMNRLGLSVDSEISDGILDIVMVMSHFSCADEADHRMTPEQYKAFKKIAQRYPHAKKSLANSSGIFRSKSYHFDMARPGMALYGLNPVPEQPNPMVPVVRLETRILQVRRVRKGETVGYGASYQFTKEATIATVALGYADGFLRTLGNSGSLYYKGKACPIRERVSMDLVTVDTGDASPVVGDMMEVIGEHQSADDLAKSAGTIGYEILTALGSRYRRVYKD